MINTSISIKKCWFAPVAADGGCGTDWQEIQIGQREGTLKFNGSSADTTTHKGVTGNSLARSKKKGEHTLLFQLADLSPDVISQLTGGTSETSADGVRYDAPLDQNQDIEFSFRLLSASMVEYILPRVAIDGFPVINDDDLHYYNIDGTLLSPEKVTVPIHSHLILSDAAQKAAAITGFTMDGFVAVATITAGAKTVAITLPSGTVKTALVPHITTSPGSSIAPIAGVATDFTSAKPYVVTAADGTEATWTVTVTVTP